METALFDCEYKGIYEPGVWGFLLSILASHISTFGLSLGINSPAKYISVLTMQHNHFLQGDLVGLFLRVHKLTAMLTSKDLLYKALDYDGFWNISKKMKDSKPSKSRKVQLDKLLKGFGITKKNAKAQSQVPREVNSNLIVQTVYSTSRNPKSMSRIEYIKTLTDFQYFTQGEFIADIDRAKYQNLIEQIISNTKAIFPEQSKIIDKEPINLVRLFTNLYNFRLNVYHMFKYNFSQKMNEKFSIEDDYSLYLRKKFMESMANNLSEVDEVLCMLIDAEKRKMKEDEIDYPHFDLKAIDEEWLNERRR